MSLIGTFENIDQKIVLAINGAHSPLLDYIMYYASNKFVMIPFYILIIYFLHRYYGWKNTGIILATTILLIVITDLTCTYLFKETFMRYRPTHNLLLKDKLHIIHNYRGGQYGFISSHAANMSAIVFFISGLLKQKLKYFFPIALLILFIICYSRIYLGVHYLSDILIGVLVGLFFANRFLFILKKSNLISKS